MHTTIYTKQQTQWIVHMNVSMLQQYVKSMPG